MTNLPKADNAMKYLFVLTSDIYDYYLEQALLSITSLRLQMPSAYITLLTDDITEANLTDKRKNILSFVDELIPIKIDSSYNKKARSRWLKTSMRQHLKGDFLFIDCDTIITDDLSVLGKMNINLGSVLNEHINLSGLKKYNPSYFENTQLLGKKLNFNSTINSDYFFNSGVMLCRDLPIVYNFFEKWHELWHYCFEQGIVTDQQSFNQANFLMGNVISELEGQWNCQILADGGINYLYNAKIIHYFGGMKEENPYLLASKDITKDIKETGIVSKKIIESLNNSKCLFLPNSKLRVADKFSRSFSYIIVKKIFNSKFGAFIESILVFVYKYIFTPIRKLLSKT